MSQDDQQQGKDQPRWTVEPYRFPDAEPPLEAPRPHRPSSQEPSGEPPQPRSPGREADGGLRIFLPPEPSTGAFGQRSGPIPPPPPPPRQPRAKAPRREPAGRLRGRKRLALALGAVLLILAACSAGAGVYLFHDLPSLPATETLFVQNRAPAMVFQDQQGHVLASRGKKAGYRVKLSELPGYVPQAFLAAEDRRFYSHGPIDIQGALRAAIANLSNRRVVQGGSTITQQIVKTLVLKPERRLKRKAQEAVLAWRLEQRLGKDEVLELYLNRIFFGEGAYGVDAAAQIYFGKSAAQLSLTEASLLAALPQQPSRFALRSNMAGAIARQHLILQTMADQGWINQRELSTALATQPRLAPLQPGEGDIGYVLDYAAAEAVRIAGPGAPDLLVTLTIDPHLQATAQDALRRALAGDGRAAHAGQGAFVAMTPDGAIRALVGGLDHQASAFNRATQARRQPGSSFKPFVYAAALEDGVRPTDVLIDGPVRIGKWSPGNYGGGYRGAVTVQTALAQSINTVAVKLGQKVGAHKIAELARRFGLRDIPENPDLAISLGAKEVTLLDLVSGYQVFQNAGERRDPHLIAAITSTRGNPIFSHMDPPSTPVYDKGLAGEMVQMMRGVVEHGTGTRASFGRPAAGKTGTSQDWRDAWFVGFTPDYVAGVWIGNDDYTPMERVAGGTLPAAIWRQVMAEAHKDLPARGFDWIVPVEAPGDAVAPEGLPPPPPPPAPKPPDPRDGFYNDLASEFSAGADDD